MEYRQLGQSDVTASVITFGAWAIGGWMWGGADREEAVEAIRASFDAGVTSIDTAPVYGQGLSEEIVGRAIKNLRREQLQIFTKFGLCWNGTQGEFYFHSVDNDGKPLNIYRFAGKDSIIAECEESLRRLGTDYIDLYQIHWADATTPISETMEAVLRLMEQGKIRAAGVCNYNVAQMKEAEKVITLASSQVPYSMVFRDIEKDVVPYCLENQKAVLAYSPLQRGLLTGKIKPGHQFGKGDTREGNRFYTPEAIRKVNSFLDDLRPLAQSKGASLAQLVLRWTIEQPGITVVLAGARNAEQAMQNAKAIDVKLSKEEIEVISQAVHGIRLS